jgi:glycosyltransferase involved in cell wall biosynthesis
MENKTICFFNSTKEWGGGEKWHFDMATKMYSDNINIFVVTNKKSVLFEKLKSSNINLFAVKISNLSFLNPFKVLKIIKFLKKNKIISIIINLSADLKIAGIASKIAKVPNIIYRRGSAIPIKNTLFNRFLFKKIVTEIIANTEATKKTINQNYNFFPVKKIKVIYNGIDIQKYESNQKIITNEIKIGNLGRLVKQKAQFYLIHLAKILKDRKINFKIIIGGKGKLEEELKTLSKNFGVENEIYFEGFIENTNLFMQKIDVFVLTSIWEGFGYVLVEAMACQKPTIAFDLSSNPEIIEDNKTGFLIEFDKVEKMADKIEYFINKNEKLYEFGLYAKNRAEKLFTIEKSYNNLKEFLGF